MPNCNTPLTQFTPGNLVQFFKEIIPGFIGTYTYPNGTVVDAIAIDNVPNEVNVDGFEIIIPGYPRIDAVNVRTSRTHICQYWDIDLINHDSTKVGSLARKGEFFQMIQTIILAFPRTTYGTPISQSDPVKSLQRYRLTLKHSDGYNSPYR